MLTSNTLSDGGEGLHSLGVGCIIFLDYQPKKAMVCFFPWKIEFTFLLFSDGGSAQTVASACSPSAIQQTSRIIQYFVL